MTAAAPATYDLPDLRRRYVLAADDAAASSSLHKMLAPATERHGATVLAYRAASEALQAKHTGSIFDKLDRLKLSSQLFEAAVRLEPQRVEVRFLRYGVESNVPRFLGMSRHLEEDRALLLRAARLRASVSDDELLEAVHRQLTAPATP